MLVLNIGCGFVRPQDGPFLNLDNLHAQLPEGSPARNQLNAERNYINHDMAQPFGFSEQEFDAVFGSHTLEHFDTQEGLRLLKECKRILKPGGICCMSVPNAGYFKAVHSQDNKENCKRLFGEGIPDAEPKQTFLEYALFFGEHKHVYTEDSLWCTFVAAGFNPASVMMSNPAGWYVCPVRRNFLKLANRYEFSIIMEATK